MNYDHLLVPRTDRDTLLDDLNKDLDWAAQRPILRAYLKKHKITMSMISEALHIAPATAAMVFKQSKNPSYHTMRRIYNYLGFEFKVTLKKV